MLFHVHIWFYHKDKRIVLMEGWWMETEDFLFLLYIIAGVTEVTQLL